MIKRQGTAVRLETHHMVKFQTNSCLGVHMYDKSPEGYLFGETRYENITQNALYSHPGSHQSDRIIVFFQQLFVGMIAET